MRDETGAIIVALRKRDGTFDTTPSPDALIEVGDVLIGVGTPEEIRKLEDFFAPRRPLPANARRAARRERCGGRRRARSTLERPSDPAHGDYATNVALRLAGGATAAAARARRGARREGRRAAGRRARRGRRARAS